MISGSSNKLLAGLMGIAFLAMPLGTSAEEYCFDGWYGGFHFGGITGDSQLESFAQAQVFDDTFDLIAEDSDSVTGGSEWGGIYGLHLGRNIQRSLWVFGGEVDIAAVDGFSESMQTSAEAIAPGLGFVRVNALTGFEVDWYSTSRLKVGYVFGKQKRLQAFATAGAALGSADISGSGTFESSAGGPVPFNFRHSKTQFGWTAGSGIQCCLSDNLLLSLIYLYIDLGSVHESADYTDFHITRQKLSHTSAC
jgi:opacity protein-like surface antigen